jgi:thiamine-monophosphate kinase
MGLQILERERKIFDKDKSFKPDLAGYEYIIERQLKPGFPDNVLINLKENKIIPSSMIDVSEGLASDLLHLCKLSGTGCRIWHNRIPIDAETSRAAEEFSLDPLVPALNGGEDYELLFTLPLEDAEKIKIIPDVTMIGHMTVADKRYCIVGDEGNEIELRAQGWEKS